MHEIVGRKVVIWLFDGNCKPGISNENTVDGCVSDGSFHIWIDEECARRNCMEEICKPYSWSAPTCSVA